MALWTAVVADDEAQIRNLVKMILEGEGFSVTTACDGAQALQAIRATPPDIVVLDLQMPVMDGFDVCQALRKDSFLSHLPVIMLSAAGTRENRVNGLNLGLDDFIAKPLDRLEFLARVKMILKRSRRGLDANPLTHLPGNAAIQHQIEEALREGKPWAVLYLDLNDFKAYNDKYGYAAGDTVIQATARVILDSLREVDANGFVGHIGGDDFIAMTSPGRMEILAQRVAKKFDALAPSFYDEHDRRQGKIVSIDRQGQTREFSLLSISIGICHNQLRALTSYAQVSEYGAELKKAAKRLPGSRWIIDRRRR